MFDRLSGAGRAISVILLLIAATACGFGGSCLADLINDQPQQVAEQQLSVPLAAEQTSLSAKNLLSGAQSALSGDMTVAQVASYAAASVVEISTEFTATGFMMEQYISSGAGSGVVFSADGYIITNNHVIENANNITVRLIDGTDYQAKLIAADEKSDLAVLKIDAKDLAAARIGDSDELIVGQEVVAIGNPLGNLGGTVTNGIISAKDREITIDNQTLTLLQTNTAINPGNSGGGLFNLKGELIAIVNAKSSGVGIEGIGFAIPVNNVIPVVEELIDHGYVSGRAAIGVTLQQIGNTFYYGNRLQAGVYIYSVSNDDCPLQAGDRLISLDDAAISSLADISSFLEAHSPGDTVKAKVSRNDKKVTLTLTLIEATPQ